MTRRFVLVVDDQEIGSVVVEDSKKSRDRPESSVAKWLTDMYPGQRVGVAEYDDHLGKSVYLVHAIDDMALSHPRYWENCGSREYQLSGSGVTAQVPARVFDVEGREVNLEVFLANAPVRPATKAERAQYANKLRIEEIHKRKEDVLALHERVKALYEAADIPYEKSPDTTTTAPQKIIDVIDAIAI